MTANRFTDRSILVTGGASGIGRATALAFAREGGCVTIADLNEAGGLEIVAEIEAAGGVAQFVRADATAESAVASLVDSAVAAYGPIRHAVRRQHQWHRFEVVI